MTDFVCEPLGKLHNREQFDCGEPTLNHYLAKIAGQDVKRKAAAVFVFRTSSPPGRIVGFYSLSAIAIELSSLPAALTKKFPGYPEVPAILIGRLARDLAFPGVGSLLLADALTRCIRVAKEIAASVIVVDSKGDAATRFYKKFGFLSLPKFPDRMFLPMQLAEKL
jgi:GNAT superfamily N-acetyltransferase